MWLLSCFMPSSKQAIKGQKHHKGISHQILSSLTSVDILHNIIKYLPQGVPTYIIFKLSRNSIVPPDILQTNSLYMIFPRTYKNGQMSKILPYPFEVDQSYPYNTPSSTYVITTNLLLNTYLLLQSFIPQFTTESQLLNKKPSPIMEPGW